MKRQTFIYRDEVNDDFANVNKEPYEIPNSYRYINNNFFWKIICFIVYKIFMLPFAFIFSHLRLRPKIINKKCLKGYKGYFLFGNHTQIPTDAFIPNMITFPIKPYFIVHSDNVSTYGTQNLMKMLGAIPVPSSISMMREFNKAIDKRIKEKKVVVVFPEAHIWPYYTKIRNFPDTSFKYPVKSSAPTFCFTTTYQKRKFSKKPKATIYVDGPFFPPCDCSVKESALLLRNQVYDKMIERSKNSNYDFNKYIKEENS